MNCNFGKLAGAALISALGLSTLAISASAASIDWALGLNVQTSGYGYQVCCIANAEAIYNSSNAAPDGLYGAGITYTQNDPGASLVYSPNPSLSLGGLTGGSLGVTGSGGEAAVSASLATGATHLSAMSSYSLTSSDADALGVNMSDQLTFSGSGTITIGFALDGSTSLLGTASPVAYDPSNYLQNVNLAITGTGTAAYVEWQGTANGGSPTKFDPPTFTASTAGTQGWNNGGGSGAYSGLAYNGFIFTGTLTVTNGEVLNIDLIQSMTCNDGALCSYQNTGQLSLIDPNGVSYTSNSGVFLTQTSTTTPEPSSLMLIGLGLAAIGCVRRRRSAR